jgi:hypothetical protein
MATVCTLPDLYVMTIVSAEATATPETELMIATMITQGFTLIAYLAEGNY